MAGALTIGIDRRGSVGQETGDHHPDFLPSGANYLQAYIRNNLIRINIRVEDHFGLAESTVSDPTDHDIFSFRIELA